MGGWVYYPVVEPSDTGNVVGVGAIGQKCNQVVCAQPYHKYHQHLAQLLTFWKEKFFFVIDKAQSWVYINEDVDEVPDNLSKSKEKK